MTKREKEKFLRLSYDLASGSPDRSNQNGAVIVNAYGQMVSMGRNEFTTGIVPTAEQLADRDWKLFHIEHAERNAIFPLVGRSSADAPFTMVCQWFACGDCARAIVLSGITKVIGHKERMDMTPERWKDSVEAGLNIIRAGGVEIEFYSGKLNATPIIVNGEIWVP